MQNDEEIQLEKEFDAKVCSSSRSNFKVYRPDKNV